MSTIRLSLTNVPATIRVGDAILFTAPPRLLAAASSKTSAEELQQVLSALQISIDDLQNEHRQSLTELQQVAVELATAAASWLTFAAIDRDQFAVDQLVHRAIEQLDGNGPLQICLHPDDHRLLVELQCSGQADSREFAMNNVQFIDDASLSRGSCVAKYDSISLVSNLESRLAGIRQDWLESLDDAQTERRATDPNGRGFGRVPDRRETA